jgi:hypothetical protein
MPQKGKGKFHVDTEPSKLHIVKDVVVIFREAFSHDLSIHPSIHPVIHPWMASYREENPGRNK